MAEANVEGNEMVEGIANLNIEDGEPQGFSGPCRKDCNFHDHMPPTPELPIGNHKIRGIFDCDSSYVVYLLYCEACEARYVGCTTSTFKIALKRLLGAMDQDRRLIDHFTSRREIMDPDDCHRQALKAYIICTIDHKKLYEELPKNADEKTIKEEKKKALIRLRDSWIDDLFSMYDNERNETGLNTATQKA